MLGAGGQERRRSVSLLVNSFYAFDWMDGWMAAAAAASEALEFEVKQIDLVVEIMTFHP